MANLPDIALKAQFTQMDQLFANQAEMIAFQAHSTSELPKWLSFLQINANRSLLSVNADDAARPVTRPMEAIISCTTCKEVEKRTSEAR